MCTTNCKFVFAYTDPVIDAVLDPLTQTLQNSSLDFKINGVILVWLKTTFNISLKRFAKNGDLDVKGTEQKALSSHGHAHKSKASLIFLI